MSHSLRDFIFTESSFGSSWLLLPAGVVCVCLTAPPLMAERAAAASDLTDLHARAHDLKRQLQELKAQKKGHARKKARTARTLFQVVYACWRCLAPARK